MRFTLSSSVLSSKLGLLSKVINSKNSLSILDCFLFEVQDGQLKLTASDNANMLQLTIDLTECEGEGSFCIPNRIILTAVKELSDQPLTLEVNTDDNSIRMRYQTGVYNIVGLSSDEYPRIQPMTGNKNVTKVTEGSLASNIQRSLFATANDELRMVMNGLYFDLKEESLNIVASDGQKLVRNMIFASKNEIPAAFILPKKPSAILRTLFSLDSEEMVQISFDASNAEIEFANGWLSCRLIEGRFPNYAMVIPTDNPNIVTIDRRALVGALRRVVPFASESTHLIRVRLSMNNLELNAEDIDFATSAHEDVMCDYGGPQMSIGFNGLVLMDILNNIVGDEIVMELGDPSRAGVFRPTEQPEGEDVLMLAMPMLLND